MWMRQNMKKNVLKKFVFNIFHFIDNLISLNFHQFWINASRAYNVSYFNTFKEDYKTNRDFKNTKNIEIKI